MFCTKCGVQNGEDNTFCVSCGASLKKNAPSAPIPQTTPETVTAGSFGYKPPAQTQVKTAKKTNYALVGIISVAAVAVIVVVILLLAFGGGNPLVGTWVLGEDWGYDQSITFSKNGTVKVTYNSDEQTGKYTVKGNTLTIVTDADQTTTKADFKVTKEKGKTVLVLTVDGESMTLYRK